MPTSRLTDLRGRLVHDKASNALKLSLRNWECGIVLPVPKIHVAEDAVDGRGGLSDFAGVVPVPVRTPSASLEQIGTEPWFFGGFGGV